MEPILQLIQNLNWVDLVYVVLFLRIGYIAFKKGFIVEVSKLCGALLAVYLSLHYYTMFSDMASPHVLIEGMPLQFLDFFFFVLLAFLAYAVSIFVREGLSRLIKLEAIPVLHKWGGFAIAAARATLLASLLSYGMWTSTVSYVSKQVHTAYFGTMFIKAAPAVYKALWEGLLSRFMKGEQFNDTVTEVLGALER